MEQQTLFKVRDLRKKDQYKIDDKYLNGYAKVFGPATTAVYNSLSRHAEFHTQEAFPSEELIAEEHGIGIKSVQRSIKRLIGANIIKTDRVRRQGKWLNNNYFLIDKSEWKPPEDIKTLWRIKRKYKPPEDIKDPFHRTLKPKTIGQQDPIKDTHIKDNKYKDNKDDFKDFSLDERHRNQEKLADLKKSLVIKPIVSPQDRTAIQEQF